MILCKVSTYILMTLTIVLLFLLLIVLFFKLLAHFITNIGAVLVYLVLLYQIGRYFCVIAAFPGSFWLWKRHVEYQF